MPEETPPIICPSCGSSYWTRTYDTDATYRQTLSWDGNIALPTEKLLGEDTTEYGRIECANCDTEPEDDILVDEIVELFETLTFAT